MWEIADKSIDMILCDLPYGTTNCKWDSPIDLSQLWKQYNRIIKSTTPVLLFAQTPFDKVLGTSNLSMLRYEYIWEKTEATGHLNAKKMPMKAHENILVFYKKLPVYHPQKTSGHVLKKTVKTKDITDLYSQQNFDRIPYKSTERYPRSVIKHSTDKQRCNLHPTQKPVALLEYFIRTYTNPGDTVLDNTMGSGSTGVACLNTGRNFIGIEKDSEYFYKAKERIQNHK